MVTNGNLFYWKENIISFNQNRKQENPIILSFDAHLMIEVECRAKKRERT